MNARVTIGSEATAEGEENRFAPALLTAANINPVTRLATDYLNHFNNVVMLLDLVADMPEFAEEILAWRPATYQAYFSNAHFRERDLAVDAYAHADPAVRAEFESVVADLDAAVAEAQAVVADPAGPAGRRARLGGLVRERLQPLIARAGGIVNAPAASIGTEEFLDNGSTQDTIDELFH